MSYAIVAGELAHVYALARVMRSDDRLEATGLGRDPRRMLRQSFRHSLYARSAFVDGEIAAMWGLAGSILSDEGEPWLVTSRAVERVPVAFLREARRELAAMLHVKRRLSSFVAASYHRAVRFLRLLGFTIGEAVALGPKKTLFHPIWIEVS